jgi:hypothetical protein
MEMNLYMAIIGATPAGRHTEQHDTFFGIGESIAALKPKMELFWPEAVGAMHLDAYRKVTLINNYKVSVVNKESTEKSESQLFFINLGGYKEGEFDEFHYKMVIAAKNKTEAIQLAKQTAFYKHTGFKGAESHIDDKYGIDVDDIHNINDILPNNDKQLYKIVLKPAKQTTKEDDLKIGYFKWSKL